MDKNWKLYFAVAWLFFISSFFIKDKTDSNILFMFFVIFSICSIVFFFLELKLENLDNKYTITKDHMIISSLMQIHKDLLKIKGTKK
jgi:hypothetical protein